MWGGLCSCLKLLSHGEVLLWNGPVGSEKTSKGAQGLWDQSLVRQKGSRSAWWLLFFPVWFLCHLDIFLLISSTWFPGLFPQRVTLNEPTITMSGTQGMCKWCYDKMLACVSLHSRLHLQAQPIIPSSTQSLRMSFHIQSQSWTNSPKTAVQGETVSVLPEVKFCLLT